MTLVPRAKTTPRKRLIGLDGTRGVLAICVIIVHVTAHFAPSILAITHVELLGQAIVVFFVMSGFLVYYPFARALLDGRSPLRGVGAYATARVFRIFPAYLVVFLIANGLGLVYVKNAMVVQAGKLTDGTGTITNPLELLLHLTLLNNYVPNTLQTGINSSWTLTVELAFYLLLPLLAAGAAALAVRVFRSSRPYVSALVPGVALILVGSVSRVVGAVWASKSSLNPEMGEWGPNMLAVFSRSLLVWSDNFGWGMVAVVIYLAFTRGHVAQARVLSIRRISWAVLLVGFAASGAAYLLAPRFIGAAFAALSAAVVMLLVLPIDGEDRVWRMSRFMDNPVFFWLGTTSLSIYLWHYPVILILERWGWIGGDAWLPWLWSIAVVAAVSTALASVTYLLVEKPAMDLSKRLRKAARA